MTTPLKHTAGIKPISEMNNQELNCKMASLTKWENQLQVDTEEVHSLMNEVYLQRGKLAYAKENITLDEGE